METAVQYKELPLELVDDQFINPETGEIIERSYTQKDMSGIARQILANNHRSAMIQQYVRDEIERLQRVAGDKVAQIQKGNDFWLKTASELMLAAGQPKVEIPGLGTFKFSKTRESVNDDAWAEFDQEKRDDVRKERPGLFTEKITYSPSKPAIMAALKADQSVPGFAINEKKDKFEFKEDKAQ